MKKAISVLIGLLHLALLSQSQSKYLSDIIMNTSNVQYRKGYTAITFDYWRYDTCLYLKQMCKYNTATSADVKVHEAEKSIIYEFLRGNNSGYQSKNPYDTFKYVFVQQDINRSQLVRTLLSKDKYIRIDTFNLTAVDTLLFDNYPLIKKILENQKLKN